MDGRANPMMDKTVVGVSGYLSVCLTIHPSIHTSIHPSFYPSIHPPVHPSLYLSIGLLYLPVNLSGCLSICLSMSLSIGLSISLSFSKLENEAILRNFLQNPTLTISAKLQGAVRACLLDPQGVNDSMHFASTVSDKM